MIPKPLRVDPRLLIDIGLLTLMRVVAITIGLLFVKVYTNSLTPEAIGIFFYLATLSYLLNALIFVPFDYYIQAYCAHAGDSLPLRPIARMTGGVLIAALGLVLVVGATLVALGELALPEIGSLYLVAVLLFGCTSLRNLLNNRGHRRTVAAALVFEALFRVCAFLALAKMLAPSGHLLFASAAVALLLELLGLGMVAAARLPWSKTAEAAPTQPLLGATAPVSASAGCNLVQLQGYRTLYPWCDAPASAALFAVVANVGSAAMAAGGQIFSQILLPRIYHSKGAFVRVYIGLAALLTVVVAAVAWLVATPLVAFISSPSYTPYAGLIVFGVLMEGANLILAGLTAGSMLQGDTRRLMAWNVVGALLAAAGYALALAIAPRNPAAIGLAVVVSQCVVIGGLVLQTRRVRG